MNVIVDTSVWIDAFQKKHTNTADQLIDFLDRELVFLVAPIYLELLSGASNQDQLKLKRLLNALPIIYPTQKTWDTAIQWTQIAKQKGYRFGVIDLIIGVLAYENLACIWSLDKDFMHMQKLGFIQLSSGIKIL